MINQDNFKTLMREIVATEFPTELTSYDQGGDRVINKVYANRAVAEPSQSIQQFQFIAEATVVLQFVQLIAATFLAVKKIWDVVRPSSPSERQAILSEEWRKQLVEAGIQEEKALAIVARFSKDLEAKLNQQA